MTPIAIGTGLAILAFIGLVIGLVVLLVVVVLLTAVLTPIRGITRYANDVPEVAPFMTDGVRGVDGLRRTGQLANSLPPLAEAYLAKLAPATPATEAPPPRVDDGSPDGLISGGKA